MVDLCEYCNDNLVKNIFNVWEITGSYLEEKVVAPV
jgi:hypothetical protein